MIRNFYGNHWENFCAYGNTKLYPMHSTSNSLQVNCLCTGTIVYLKNMLICTWLLIERLILVCFQEWLISYRQIMQGILETSWSVCLTWTVQTLSLYWMKAPRRSLTATLTLWHEERTDMDTDLYLTDLEVKVADGFLQCLVICVF